MTRPPRDRVVTLFMLPSAAQDVLSYPRDPALPRLGSLTRYTRPGEKYRLNSYTCDRLDARLPITEANDLLEINLPLKEFHTLGGLFMAHLRHIPEKNEP